MSLNSDTNYIFEAVITLLIGLGGFVLNLFSGKIKEIENSKIDRSYLDARLELMDNKLQSLNDRVTDFRAFNEQDHGKMDERMKDVQKSIDEMKECLNKLARNREC